MNKSVPVAVALCVAASASFSLDRSLETPIEPTIEEPANTDSVIMQEYENLLKQSDDLVNNLLMEGINIGERLFTPDEDGGKSQAEQLLEETLKYKDRALKYSNDVIECATGLDQMPEAPNPLEIRLEKHQIIALLMNDEIDFNFISAHDPKSGLTYTFNNGEY